MILDHMHLDIVIDTKTSKITTFPKKEMSEEIYGFQRNYLEYLRKEGVVIEDSIRSGNVFGSLEAAYPPSSEPTVNATQVVLLSTKKFLDKQENTIKIIHNERIWSSRIYGKWNWW